MKKRTKFFVASISALLMLTGLSSAATINLNGVTKVNYQIMLNGKRLELPSYLTVMNKDNSTYVPLRFLSENMGLEVDYKPGTVLINSESFNSNQGQEAVKKQAELQKEITRLTEENSNLKNQLKSIEEGVLYRKIPVVADSGNGLRITLNNIAKTSNGIELSVDFENTSEERYFVVDPFKTQMIVDGETYNATTSTEAQLNSILNSAPDKYSPTIQRGKIYISDVEKDRVKGNLLFTYNDNGDEIKYLQVSFDNSR